MPWSSLRNKPTDKTNQRREKMNNKFDELTKRRAQSVTRRQVMRRLPIGLAVLALAWLLALPSAVADPNVQTSTVLDPAGDAVFPHDLFGAPVPPYLDMIKATVSYSRGV